jgi:hypothetical protein
MYFNFKFRSLLTNESLLILNINKIKSSKKIFDYKNNLNSSQNNFDINIVNDSYDGNRNVGKRSHISFGPVLLLH